MCGSAIANYVVSMCPRLVSNARAFRKIISPIGKYFPHCSAAFLMIGVLLSRSTVRILWFVARFVMWLASVEHVDPNTGVLTFICFVKSVQVLIIYANFFENN